MWSARIFVALVGLVALFYASLIAWTLWGIYTS